MANEISGTVTLYAVTPQAEAGPVQRAPLAPTLAVDFSPSHLGLTGGSATGWLSGTDGDPLDREAKDPLA